jgi:hydroxymethylpyrimidine/phosphomethylpyrimidine kinase
MKPSPPIPRVLTIAGSDSSGAAGAQADLKTFEARGVYGMSALTMLTAQNSTGIQAVQPLPIEFIASQIDSVLTDIGADAIKTGLLLRAETVRLVADKVQQYAIESVVVDPVLIDGAGRRLIDAAAEEAYRTALFPKALIITPNLDEAGLLVGKRLENVADIRKAAVTLAAYGSRWILIKGGHLQANSNSLIDILYDPATDEYYEFRAPRLPVGNTRGPGCTLASAIAAEIAKGWDVPAAVEAAKRYVGEALLAASEWKLGAGRGTLYHGYAHAEPF